MLSTQHLGSKESSQFTHTFQGCVECHRPSTNNHVPKIRQDEDRRLGVPDAVLDALEAEPHEHHISRRVDQLGAVHGDVVVLVLRAKTCKYTSLGYDV